MDPEPNFDEAKQTHVTSKKDELNEFKSRAAAATLLGISERLLARITGSVLIGTGKSTDYTRKINIGLQMKSNSPVRLKHLFYLDIFRISSEIICFISKEQNILFH